MNKFINEQISVFKKKYKYEDIIQELNYYKKIPYLLNTTYYDYIFKVIIKDNALVYNIEKYNKILIAEFSSKIKRIINILKNLVKIYKIDDTIIFINIADDYIHTELPIFNLSLPYGINGFIFPNYDMNSFFYTNGNFNNTVKLFNNFNPDKIINCIYFKGGRTTNDFSKIREKLNDEQYPFNVISIWGKNEPLYYIKKYKYLLDLPGGKPWSIRLKYLALSERLIIRISFYNSKFGETDYWRQFTDIYIKEDIDYIHLKYDVDYDKEINDILYSKIKRDILNIYYYFEKNPNLYNKMVKNLKKHSKNLNIKNMYKYLHILINDYTEIIKK